MGQYQQWLFAQEVDRHLRAERETLETELLYLQDRIAIMEQAVPEVENRILQALEQYFQAQAARGEARKRCDPPGAICQIGGHLMYRPERAPPMSPVWLPGGREMGTCGPFSITGGKLTRRLPRGRRAREHGQWMANTW